jgi:uncharacterized protein YjiS (DUF1127 family)
MRTTTMTASTSSLIHGVSPSIEAALGLARHILARPFHMIRTRRQFRELQGMSNQALRDIGLTRLDVDTAAILPWSVDPTAVLSAMVQERQRLSGRPW